MQRHSKANKSEECIFAIFLAEKLRCMRSYNITNELNKQISAGLQVFQ